MAKNNKSEDSRITRLALACLSVTSSLDLTTVLHSAVKNACKLTGASFGVVSMLGEFEGSDGIAMWGIAARKLDRIWDWGDKHRALRHFQGLTEPLRVKCMRGYVEEIGMTGHVLPKGPFQSAPMYYREELIGNLYLAKKRNKPEFSDEDEEILLLFAAQAATAIANARTCLKSRKSGEPVTVRLGGLIIDSYRRQVELDGRKISLTPMEFELLQILALNEGRAMSYEYLLRQIWDSHNDMNRQQRVRTHIKTLRRKLGRKASQHVNIENVYGSGYRLSQPLKSRVRKKPSK